VMDRGSGGGSNEGLTRVLSWGWDGERVWPPAWKPLLLSFLASLGLGGATDDNDISGGVQVTCVGARESAVWSRGINQATIMDRAADRALCSPSHGGRDFVFL
jgi:hypothetical protein